MHKETFQAQAPICPFCNDDHSLGQDCKLIAVKRTLLAADIYIAKTKLAKLLEDETLNDKGRKDAINKALELLSNKARWI